MLLPAFTELKRNLKKDFSSFPVIKLGIIGDCATQHIAVALRGWGYEKGINFDIFPDNIAFVASDIHKLVRFRDLSIQAGIRASFILPKKPTTLPKYAPLCI